MSGNTALMAHETAGEVCQAASSYADIVCSSSKIRAKVAELDGDELGFLLAKIAEIKRQK